MSAAKKVSSGVAVLTRARGGAPRSTVRATSKESSRRWPWFAMTVLSIVVLMAIFAPVLARHNPDTVNLANRFQPPMWMHGGSASYWLGTDDLGRDVASRLMYGARTSLLVGIVGVSIGGAIGLVFGILAGYFRGWFGNLIMRLVDGCMALPLLLIAMVMAVALGESAVTVIVAVSIVLWSRFARVVRGEVLEIMNREFVLQARVSAASALRIMRVHVLPNVANTFIVLLTLDLAWVILTEASLSFLGAGIPPPAASWGGMIAEGQDYVTTAWWISVFPGAVLALTILAVNMLGDWLRDRLDPKLRDF